MDWHKVCLWFGRAWLSMICILSLMSDLIHSTKCL